MAARDLKLILCLVYCLVLAQAANTRTQDPQPRREGVLNEACSGNEDCGKYGYFCSPWNRTCQCQEQYLPDPIKNSCLGGVEQKCKYDEHCIEGAFCMNQASCQCKDRHPVVSWNGLRCSGSPESSRPTLLPTFMAAVLLARLVS